MEQQKNLLTPKKGPARKRPYDGQSETDLPQLVRGSWVGLVSCHLTIVSRECGVLIPAAHDMARPETQHDVRPEARRETSGTGLGLFTNHVPIPMEFPGVPLSTNAGEGLTPWFYQDG